MVLGTIAESQPSNLTWWNERTDVDKFYQAMDLFLFTSRGHENDKKYIILCDTLRNDFDKYILSLKKKEYCPYVLKRMPYEGYLPT